MSFFVSHRRQNFIHPTLGLRDRYFDLFFAQIEVKIMSTGQAKGKQMKVIFFPFYICSSYFSRFFFLTKVKGTEEKAIQ